ncbi:hypothetical protein B9T27_01200 [Acinetobacter sp. ANC 4648]|nr:hypothetical protein B9T27_01200 [Acinetobacter sp. ANC 4648]
MFSVMMNHKIKLSFTMLLLIVCSIAATIISNNTLSDSVSITSGVLLSLGLVVMMAFIILEALEAICNP